MCVQAVSGNPAIDERAGKGSRLLVFKQGYHEVPWEFLQPCTLRKNEVLGIEAISADWAVAFEGVVNLVPQVVAGERDMAPGQRCDLGEKRIGDSGSLVMHEADGAAEIYGVPQDDRVDDEVEAVDRRAKRTRLAG